MVNHSANFRRTGFGVSYHQPLQETSMLRDWVVKSSFLLATSKPLGHKAMASLMQVSHCNSALQDKGTHTLLLSFFLEATLGATIVQPLMVSVNKMHTNLFMVFP